MRHEDARRAVIRFIEEHWNKTVDLEIITGNSSRMREIVVEVLTEYRLDYSVGGLIDRTNKGYILIFL
jgi:hypothetical protein